MGEWLQLAQLAARVEDDRLRVEQYQSLYERAVQQLVPRLCLHDAHAHSAHAR